jgi:hypothetical protein
MNIRALVCRVSPFAKCSTLGKTFFAECFSLPSARHSAKHEFTVCFSLPSVALGKEALCRVPDILHSAKQLALGKVLVSGSEWWTGAMDSIWTSPCSGNLTPMEVVCPNGHLSVDYEFVGCQD